ncbi:MAG TPA: sigma factor [Planctomycetota bacterium]|nr:sigma factor [Planctomycetota bacterium]
MGRILRPGGIIAATRLAARGKTFIEAYLNDIRHVALLDAGEEERLGAEIATGSIQARNRLVMGNVRLVVSIAKKYRRQGLDFVDLVQAGNVGLVEAARRFDVGKGCRFAIGAAQNGDVGTREGKALQLFSSTPVAFIENTAQVADPSVRYVFYGNGANEVDGGIDIAGELVIDPNLMWASFLGGNSSEGEDTKDTIAIDGAGNLFFAGFTNSSDFPTAGGFDTTLFVRLPGRQHLRRQPRRLVLLLLEPLRRTLCHRHHHPALLNCGTPLPTLRTGVPSGLPAAASTSYPTKRTPPRAGRTPAGEPASRPPMSWSANASAPPARIETHL